MSNISKTSANIKKKLSLNDYRKPASQQASKPTQPRTVTPARKHASPNKPVSKPVDVPVPQPVSTPAQRQKADTKMKATFYLGEQENKMLTQLFINSLKRNAKIDKSALVCTAIRMLYERDK